MRTKGDSLVVVQRTDLDLDGDERARQLALADNRIGEVNLDWDPEMLARLQADGLRLDPLFTRAELERLLRRGLFEGRIDENAVVTPRETSIQVGDLFQLGDHRLLCGDATASADVQRLLGPETPVLMVTDPPYGVQYDPAWRHRYAPDQRTAVGAVTNDHRVDWTAAFALFEGDVAYVWHAGLHAGLVEASLVAAGFEPRAQIIWVKQHFVLSRGDYHWQHEPAWYVVRRGASSRSKRFARSVSSRVAVLTSDA